MSHQLETSSLRADAGTTLWYTRCPVPTAFGLAVQIGLVEDEFIKDPDVQFLGLRQSSDTKVHQSHFTHTQKNSFRHGGNYPAIWAQANGADTRIIGLSWVKGPYSILAHKDSKIKSAADMKGKRLLVLRRPHEPIDFAYATALRTYEKALESVGLGLADVELVERVIDRPFIAERWIGAENTSIATKKNGVNRISDLATPLLRGEVDVVADAVGIYSLRLEELLDLHVVFDQASLPNRIDHANNSTPLTFAVNAGLIKERPDLVARVYARALEAVGWSREHRSESVRYVAREQSTSEALVEAAHGPDLALTLETDLAPEKIEALRSQKAFLLKHGFIKQDFDLDAWIDPAPLNLARRLLEQRQSNGRTEYPATLNRIDSTNVASCSLV